MRERGRIFSMRERVESEYERERAVSMKERG